MQANLIVYAFRNIKADLTLAPSLAQVADATDYLSNAVVVEGGLWIDPETGGLFVDPETGGLFVIP